MANTEVRKGIVGCLFILAMMFAILASDASAEIIDDIALTTDANGEIDAVIKFSVPIQFTRAFPQRKSPFVAIYFNILQSVPRDEWQNYESHRSPPAGPIESITITTRDMSVGPKIEVQFNAPVEYRVRGGANGRSIVIHMLPGGASPRQDVKPIASAPAAPAVPVGAGVSLAAAGASVAAAVPVPAPTPAAPAPAAQTTATQQVAAAPPATQGSAVPDARAAGAPATGEVQRVQLPGFAGLPPYPVVGIPPKGTTLAGAPPDSFSLAEKIRFADNQAALGMIKGRDALLAGQMGAAIDAYNAVLRLPPNKYTQDAQVWVAIAKEKSGQATKARLEYQAFLKLYPDSALMPWVSDRLAKLNQVLPPQASGPTPTPARVAQSTKFQTSEYGSLSMYYYRGASHTSTISTVGGVQTPTSLTATDQSSLITNVSASLRSSNNEYDNRLVFQDFYSRDFLHQNRNRNRLNAAFYEIRDRVEDYSVRIGRQSAMGGGVLGRFDGISAGYGLTPNYRVNVVGGELADDQMGGDVSGAKWYARKPGFMGASLDFGLRDPIGGSIYSIFQKVGGFRHSGFIDRRAIGGNLRYADGNNSVISMVDYDTQFRKLNMFTVQGTFANTGFGDYNFLLDHRMTPSLSIRNAVNGTTASIFTLAGNGWTTSDMINLANARTSHSDTAQIGVNTRVREKLQMGADVSVTNQSGLSASGTLNPDFTTGVEGFVPAMPSTGNTWTLTGRAIANDLMTANDISIASASVSKGKLMFGQTLLFNNHASLVNPWTLDTTLRIYHQTDYTGGRMFLTAPTLKLGYRAKSNLLLETEGGIEWTRNMPGGGLTGATITRGYFSMGFRWDF